MQCSKIVLMGKNGSNLLRHINPNIPITSKKQNKISISIQTKECQQEKAVRTLVQHALFKKNSKNFAVTPLHNGES